MPSKTKQEIRDKVIELYKNGIEVLDISKQTGVSISTVAVITRPIRQTLGHRQATPEYKKIQCVKFFKEGYSAVEIGKLLNISYNTVPKILKEFGMLPRNLSDSHRKYRFDENAFSQITEESSYFIGLLGADGSIVKDKNHLTVRLGLIDKEHIEKFRKFLRSDLPIVTREREIGQNFYSIVVSSKKMTEDLAKFNIVPRKTFSFKFTPELENSVSAFRGILDGDGCLYIRKTGKYFYPHVSLVGTLEIVAQFSDFVQSACGQNKTKIRQNGNVFDVTYCGKMAKDITKLLYSDGGISLERKQKIANTIMNNKWSCVETLEGLN